MTTATLAPAPATTPARPAHREPAYLRYVTGQAVSVLGDQVWYVALSYTAVQLADPATAGAVLAVSSVPRLLLLLFGGAFVDRYGPRRLMIGSDLARGAIALTTAAIALAQPSITLLVLVALAFGVADALFLPAAGTMPPRLLAPAQLTGGLALSGLAARLALTLGAPLGGLLLPLGGLPLACLVNAATFAVSVFALWSVRPAPAPAAAARTPLAASIRDGLRHLAGHPVLRSTLGVSLLVNVGFVGPMNVGLALVADDRGWGAGGIGAMLAGFGAGAAVGSLAMLRVRPKRRLGPVLAAAAALQGAAVFSVALAPAAGWAVAATTVVGLTSGPLGVLLSALVQGHTADTHRGRIASVNTLASLGVTPLAIAAVGAAAGTFGTVATFAGSASLELVAAALCVAVPALRGATLTGAAA
ncbi:MFS transporter [Catellatospora sp. TT07R-123]|uniref:MFS transporter n=1 Tax=Catellatospora sp. TT07R-123 TaxID=2733863 RepID=UPI001B125700|nr:MFS transporter [Catellatospora sp. TT07R-123]GHJ45094.1 MFS transporter [Catellatospora sp. TT07R-123]